MDPDSDTGEANVETLEHKLALDESPSNSELALDPVLCPEGVRLCCCESSFGVCTASLFMTGVAGNDPARSGMTGDETIVSGVVSGTTSAMTST